MPTVAVNLTRNIGESGLVLLLFDGATAIGNYPLTEVPGTLGRFEADVTDELEAASAYRAIVTRVGVPVYEGWYRPSVGDVVDQPDRPVDLQPVLDVIAESEGADSAQIAADVLAGLESVQITRIGPEFDPATSTVTLIAGDDYLVANDAALTFNLTLPGINLTGATAVFSAEKSYEPVLMGTAELIDTDTDQPKLRLTWTREQTNVKPSDKYAWGAAIIDSAGLVKTIIGGPLILKPHAVHPAVVNATLESSL